MNWIEFSIDFWKLVKNQQIAGGECVDDSKDTDWVGLIPDAIYTRLQNIYIDD
jgi:hypothetical protein